MGVGETVVLKIPVSVKLGGFAYSQRAVQAARPYGSSVSEALVVALGSHLPQVVNDSEGTREMSDSGGSAYVVVVVGEGTEVAYLTVSERV
jgi:hypothetical protein